MPLIPTLENWIAADVGLNLATFVLTCVDGITFGPTVLVDQFQGLSQVI